MVAALEETIIRLERESGGSATHTSRRMKLLQGEILAALHLLEREAGVAGVAATGTDRRCLRERPTGPPASAS
jgi:hypothetical protein